MPIRPNLPTSRFRSSILRWVRCPVFSSLRVNHRIRRRRALSVSRHGRIGMFRHIGRVCSRHLQLVYGEINWRVNILTVAELPTPKPILQEHYRHISGTSIKFKGLFFTIISWAKFVFYILKICYRPLQIFTGGILLVSRVVNMNGTVIHIAMADGEITLAYGTISEVYSLTRYLKQRVTCCVNLSPSLHTFGLLCRADIRRINRRIWVFWCHFRPLARVGFFSLLKALIAEASIDSSKPIQISASHVSRSFRQSYCWRMWTVATVCGAIWF